MRQTYGAEAYQSLYDIDIGEVEYRDAMATKGVKAYRRKEITAGAVKDIELCAVWNTRSEAGRARAALRGQSAETIERRNQRNAEKTVERIVNANFKTGDIALYLTMAREATADELKKAIVWYIREIRRTIRRAGIIDADFKYLYIIEQADRDGHAIRPHIHIFVTGLLGRDWLEEKWRARYGIANATRLVPDEDGLSGFARYIQKAKRDVRRQRRWACSRNCVRPQPTRSTRLPGGKVLTKKLIADIASGRKDVRAIFEKAYPGWMFVGMRVKRSEWAAGIYVEIRMRRWSADERPVYAAKISTSCARKNGDS